MQEKKFDLATAAFLFAGVFILYLATWHGRFEGYEGETAQTAAAFLLGHFEVKRAGIGAVALYLPFVGALKMFGLAHHTALLSVVPIFYSACISVILFFIALDFGTVRRHALLFAAAVACASSVWPYANIGMEYQMTLGVTILFFVLQRMHKKGANAWWVGLILAFVTLTKAYGIIFLIPVGVNFLCSDFKNKKTGLKFFLPAIFVFILQVATNRFFHQSFFGFYKVANEFTIIRWWEGWYGLFFSFGKSLFVYNPLLTVCIIMIPQFWRRSRNATIFIFSALILLLLVNAPFIYWTDETWGPRKLIPLVPLLHLPLLMIVERRIFFLKSVTIGIFIIALYVQLLGSLFYYGKYLEILRVGDLDSLTSMRYIPELSHVIIFHDLLRSHFGGNHLITYQEASWFRWTIAGQTDTIFRTTTIDLTPYHKFDSRLFRVH